MENSEKYINLFVSTEQQLVYYREGKELKRIGDFAIHKIGEKDYLYTYKNVGFAQRCGANYPLLEMLESNCPANGANWSYRYALDNLEKAKGLIKKLK